MREPTRSPGGDAAKSHAGDPEEAQRQDAVEPSWLIDMRRTAWRRFLDLPMPSVRDEEWMRTDIRLFKLGRFNLPEAERLTRERRPDLWAAHLARAGTPKKPAPDG